VGSPCANAHTEPRDERQLRPHGQR
jgi:hypothetical protein